MDRVVELLVSHATFTANRAELGGAAFVSGAVGRNSKFISCVFEGNSAEDGGAVYLYTNEGSDVFNTSVFRGNMAGM